jgi:hypothetical protein
MGSRTPRHGSLAGSSARSLARSLAADSGSAISPVLIGAFGPPVLCDNSYPGVTCR